MATSLGRRLRGISRWGKEDTTDHRHPGVTDTVPTGLYTTSIRFPAVNSYFHKATAYNEAGSVAIRHYYDAWTTHTTGGGLSGAVPEVPPTDAI